MSKHVEVVSHGPRAEAEAVFGDRMVLVSNGTRKVLYSLVVSEPQLQYDTIADRVPQGVFEQSRLGTDGANAMAPQTDRRIHEALPLNQHIPTQVLDQMINAPSAAMQTEPLQSPPADYAHYPYAEMQAQQPVAEAVAGGTGISDVYLEQATGMDLSEQFAAENSAAQDLPVYNALAEAAATRARLPEAHDEAMAAQARAAINQVHGVNGDDLPGYTNYDGVPGAYMEL